MGDFGAVLQNLLVHFHEILNIFLVPQLKFIQLAPLLGDQIKEGGLGAWSQDCVECPQVGCRGAPWQIASNPFETCSSLIVLYISCMNEVKKCFGKVLWLDLCTRQVVSARACANQFLSCNFSGINLIDMRAVQADSCLHSEQIDTLFISEGGQEGGLGEGGVILGWRLKTYT